jgi:hypothetical protein
LGACQACASPDILAVGDDDLGARELPAAKKIAATRDLNPKEAQRLPFSLLGARYSSFRNVTLDADRMVSSSLLAPTDGIEKG